MGSVVVNPAIFEVDPSHRRIRQLVDGHCSNRVAMRAERVVSALHLCDRPWCEPNDESLDEEYSRAKPKTPGLPLGNLVRALGFHRVQFDRT